MEHTILSITNLSKVYQSRDHETRALDDVSIDIKQGEIYGLLGVNGAGKTTMSSILATLHPPTDGDVLYNGTSIYNDLMNYRRAIGFCPQSQNLDKDLTVKENLIFAGRYFLMTAEKIKERTELLMEQFDLEKYASFDVSELSGGNKQRLLIARALMHEPKIVLLDEPTVGLDPDIRRKLWLYIQRLKESGITVILTTHYLDEAEVLSDRICILQKGRVLLVESVRLLKERHQMATLEDIFLKVTQEASQEDL